MIIKRFLCFRLQDKNEDVNDNKKYWLRMLLTAARSLKTKLRIQLFFETCVRGGRVMSLSAQMGEKFSYLILLFFHEMFMENK